MGIPTHRPMMDAQSGDGHNMRGSSPDVLQGGQDAKHKEMGQLAKDEPEAANGVDPVEEDNLSQSTELQDEARAILYEFQEYTFVLPSEITRSLNFISKYGDEYDRLNCDIDELVRQLVKSDSTEKTLDLRRRILHAVKVSSNDRLETYTEAQKLYDNLDAKFNTLSSEIEKLEQLEPNDGVDSDESEQELDQEMDEQRRKRKKERKEQAEQEEEEPLFCICDDVSYGQMVACDNENECPKEWFHLECVGLTNVPKGTWYCPLCSSQFKKKRKK